MSTAKSKTLPNISKQAEEQYLTETLEVIQDNLQNYGQKVTQMRNQIDDMLEHFHDDNPELINQLENTITMHDHMKRALERNERALNKPYFGRIIFRDLTYGKDESLYIGKGGIAKDATHSVVIDWRAPVSNAYYENGLGQCSYPSPDGTPVHIDLQMKRTYEIASGKLLHYFDSEVIANDDLLTRYLSKNKQAVLGEIVATIQKEQNDIIRKTPYHNVIVQGVAGSGKTTVAMHRISFILYNYAERFHPDDFYIVGSNRILLNYITGVLPDLDVYGVRQMTMEQLFVRLLYEDWDNKKYSVKSSGHTDTKSSCKGSLSWFYDLQEYCRLLEWNTIPRESIFLNPKQFVEGIREGKPGVFDETGGKPPIPGTLVELMNQSAVERYIRQNPTVSIQSKIDMLNERLHNKINEEFLGKGVKYTEPEKKAIIKAYRNRYGAKDWKDSIYKIYEDFLRKQIAAGYHVDIPDAAFDVYDLAALSYLYKRIKETEVISEAHHIVIDEAQDFGMMAYSVLKFCIKDCTYTIMGDVSQNIHFGYGLNDWEDLKALYLSDPKSSFGVLKKSYRNTIEISHFATDILHHGQFSVYPVEPIIRHGEPVKVKMVPEDASLVQKAAEICHAWQDKGLDTMAVICRDQDAAISFARKLEQLVPVIGSDLEKTEFGKGIMVLPVEYTKGLEFDAVLILDPTRQDYPTDDGHAKLLYVAATRALHELCILHTGNLTGLIADPVPERTFPIPQTAPVKTSGTSRPQTVTSAEKRSIPLPRPSIAPAIPTPIIHTDYTGKTKPPAPVPQPVLEPGNGNHPTFGDIPATELLRPLGHPKMDTAIRWITKQPDGLYLQSRYGILRISPIGSSIIRITFAKGNQITEGTHPLIQVTGCDRMWMYKSTAKTVDLMTDELCLQTDKATGAIQYMTRDRKILLTEHSKDCRHIQAIPSGKTQCRLYLDWQKGENLYGLDQLLKPGMNLRGTARYISHDPKKMLPFLLSDKGYGILPISNGTTFCCNISTYGSYLYTENTLQMDYYFIAGKKVDTILAAYAYLTGKNP